MKSLLVTAVTVTFVLALFLHSGSALVCYKCDGLNCNTNVTCVGNQDACILIRFAARNVSDCWRYSDCNTDFIENRFPDKDFRFKCCTWNLCNDSPIIVGSKVVLSVAFLLAVVQMLHF
ncbi:CD59 glycoprotein-like [Python bivittatus]|uniref:MAC-inhibitory protein n=1 Tax=Python bivittatus TaxID=176946 RepID=A0A9F2R1B0_PYTBI|nr:CD59 glycoprotein-like [Python bivittatus]